jgi:SAM-dependent methyltransferase
MITSYDRVRVYYDLAADREDERLFGRQLEYDMMIARLVEYLPPKASVLEVGAGSGHYSAALVREGHHVTAVDLSPRLVAKCTERLRATGSRNWQTTVADARTLLGVGGGYDAALVMGPMYHLPDASERSAALRAVWNRLAPRGIVLTTWLSRFGILGQLLATAASWADDIANVGRLLDEGSIDDHTTWYCTDVGSVVPFHEQAGFETVRLYPLDPGVFGTDDVYNNLPCERQKRWLTILTRQAEEPSMIGCSRHLLYVGRKAERCSAPNKT